MKKFALPILIIITILAVTMILIFMPADRLLSKIPVIKSFYSNTNLSITTPNSKSEIEVNGKDYGETSQVIGDLEEGTYQVKLSRISGNEAFYDPQTFTIELTRNTESVISVELGPQNIKSGYMLFYTPAKSIKKSAGSLSVSTEVPGVSIYIDNEYISEVPLKKHEISATNHVIKITAEGYETIEVPVIINEDYHLNIVAYLMPIPTELI
ncbi:PEGA domain-containing protein [Candidatus Dojkabacteria bacterium]|nr:PEGA domain-containing protein [Candidatus Dojkabacteria bacterium]